jgi:putative ABC transport system permease protein
MTLLRRIQYWLRWRQADADLAEEIEFHRAMLGDSRRRELGNVTLAREDARAVWIWPWVESLWQDIWYALRALRRHPGFTATALLVLGVAIGLNVSLLASFRALVYQPWPIRHPNDIVQIMVRMPDGSLSMEAFRPTEYRVVASQVRTFSGVGLWEGGNVRLDSGEAFASFVSGNFFTTLGVSAARGRVFAPSDDQAEAPSPVAILSYGTWKARFDADPEIVGKTIRVNGTVLTVIGIAEPEFGGTFMGVTDLWMPLAAGELLKDPRGRSDRQMRAFGRLAPGVSFDQARTELTLLARQLGRGHPASLERKGRIEFLNTNYAPRGVGGMPLMLGAVFLLLLLACANVGNLLLARSAARSRELAVRQALGASRLRLVRQLLTENLVLGSGAAAIAVGLAVSVPDVILTRMFVATTGSALAFHVGPDAPTLIYTGVLTLFACVAFGLAPALYASHASLTDALKTSGLRLRGILLSLQVAASVVLLICAGLLLRAVWHAAHQDLGFNVRGVSLVTVDLPGWYEPERIRAVAQRLFEESGELAATTRAPFDRMRAPAVNVDGQLIASYAVSGSFFEALRIPLIAGRSFDRSDVGRKVVIVNEAAARTHPLGTTVRFGGGLHEIIGVARNADTEAAALRLESVQPLMYRPLDLKIINQTPSLLIDSSAADRLASLTALVARIDPDARVHSVPLSHSLDRILGFARTIVLVANLLGVLSLLMVSVGIYGVFAYVVQQRTREIGIRVALGAQPAQVIGVMLRSTSIALGVGLSLGLAGALICSRLLGSSLYGLSPLDPFAYVGVALVLSIAALAASYMPASRAMAIDPSITLRYD